MSTSPESSMAARSLHVSSVGLPAGTITHTARGGSSCSTTSSSECAAMAPSLSAAFTVSGLRSEATPSCPCSINRLVMFPPMRPSPTMPILMNPPVRRSGQNVARPRLQLVHRDPEDAAAVGLQALVVADGLGRDERAEVVGEAGDGDVRAGTAAHQLDGHHAVRAALVELAGGVEEAGPVAGRDGHASVGVAQVAAQPLQP